MLGSHLSVAGGLVNALLEARRLQMETVQIFTKNQRQWAAKPLDPDVSRAWLDELHRLEWSDRTVSHASYLINLASPEDDLHRKSIHALTDEVERCEALEIPYCVVHPGSHRESGLARGIRRIVKGLNEVTRRTRGFRSMILLETTVGGGAQVGGEFEHLAEIHAKVRSPERVGTCFDTCHVSAAGYAMRTRDEAREVLEAFDSIVGLETLRCFHLNDSKEPIGSHKDRHAHIGEGHVGSGIFEFLMNESRFQPIPMILETEKTATAKGTPMDAVNLRRLRRLIDK